MLFHCVSYLPLPARDGPLTAIDTSGQPSIQWPPSTLIVCSREAEHRHHDGERGDRRNVQGDRQ
jgi:hypothetical protein